MGLKLTLMGGCCEWQNVFILFCRFKLASVKITHCSGQNSKELNVGNCLQQTEDNNLDLI